MQRLILVLFSALIFSNSFSQNLNPSDRLVSGQINLLYLDYLVKSGIDSVRIAHGLKPLLNDTVLFAAAKDHAAYLNKNNLLSHFENDIPAKYSPQDRVHFHGDSTMVAGENVLSTFALTPLRNKYDDAKTPPHTNETYGQLAADMVSGWVHSPPHYRNMLDARYEFTGVAVDYNPADNSFKAVQVFGYKPNSYSPGVSDSLIFPFSNFVPPPVVSSFDQVSHDPHSDVHAWRLRAPEDSAKTCPDCWSENFTPGSTSIRVKNGKVIFYTEDAEIMKNLLNNRKDGLVVEIVNYKPFDCGNPQYYQNASRRNGQCIFSGRIFKPLYRKKLKHGFKKKHHHNFKAKMQDAKFRMKETGTASGKLRAIHDAFIFPFDAESFSCSLGKIPKDVSGYYELNLVIIQKKQVCRVVHFTSFCGEDWYLQNPVPEIVKFTDDTFRLESKEKEYEFNVPFEQGKYEYNYKDIKPFLDSLGLSGFTVLNAKINAFASVEGTEEINKRLQLQRANSIVKAMQENQHDSITTFISTNENWPLFEKQCSTVPAFAVFKGKSHDEVKQMIASDSALARKIEPWLSKERTAKIKLRVRVDFLPQNNCEWLVKRFSKYSDSALNAKAESIRPLFLDSLTDLQAWYYNQLLNKSGDTSCLRQIVFPAKSIFDTLMYNQAWMKHHFLSRKDTLKSDKEFYTSCIAVMDLKKNPYWPAVYMMALYDVKYWNNDDNWSGNPKTTKNWIYWLRAVVPDSMLVPLQLLELNWHYKAVAWFEKKGKNAKPDVIESLSAIANYWLDDSRMNDSLALVLCNYLIGHNQVAWGAYILQPYAIKANPRHDVLMKYLQLTYRHVEEDPGFANYYRLIAWSKEYLTHEEWCSLFVGPCNISFQLWDSEGLRNLYCEECADWKNYAERPELWKKDK